MVGNARYDLGVKYFRKEIDKADFLIIMIMVNTCWLIPHNSKWPLSSLPHFKCLTFSEFRVFWVPLWYPKIIMFKTMTPKLSNAVLHVPLWSLGGIWHPCEDGDIFANSPLLKLTLYMSHGCVSSRLSYWKKGNYFCLDLHYVHNVETGQRHTQKHSKNLFYLQDWSILDKQKHKCMIPSSIYF